MNKITATLLLTLFLHAAQAQIITTVAGSASNSYTGDGGPATAAGLNNPLGVAVDASGNIYISDTKHHCIRKVNTSGTITTITGNGTAGYSGLATTSRFNPPLGIDVDNASNIFIAEYRNNCISKVSTPGIINTLTAAVSTCYSGDNGPATYAKQNRPFDVVVDKFSIIYVVNNNNGAVRKVALNSIISTVVVLM